MPPLTAEQLQAQAADLEKRLHATQALLAAVRAYETAVGLTSDDTTASRATSAGVKRPAPAMQATEDVAAELMESKGAPIATAQVVEEMRRRGIEVPEKNTNNVISARLSNSEKFKGQRGQGYWFSDRPWPTNGFDEILG